jgi:hypothetical protein
LPKNVAVYTFTALLLVVAIFGFTVQRKQRPKEISPSTLSNAAVTATTLPVSPVVPSSLPSSLPSGGELPAAVPVDTKNDKVALANEVNRTNDKPPRLRPPAMLRVVSTDTQGNNDYHEKEVGLTNIGQPQTNPAPAAVEVRRQEVPAPLTTTKPATIGSNTPPVKRTLPSSSELITGSKSSAPKGKVILWP